MSINTEPTVESRDVTAPTTSPVARLIAGSLAAGATIALVLDLVVFAGGTESTITGSALIAFGFGWGLIAALTARYTSQPQSWAVVPAVAMGATGLALLTLSPGDAALERISWVWPPIAFAMAVWMFIQMRRHLVGRGRWLLTPVIVVLGLVSVGATYQNTVVRDQTAYPAPGKTYDVGGHRLHLDCRGSGGPTVVLFNGMGEISASWAHITDAVDDTTRVCAYDRAGQGWSDDAQRPQDGINAASELHALLDVAGEDGPYVLVGHSTGGTYAMTYAAEYSGQVAGLVLLDTSSPEQFTTVTSYPSQYAVMRRGMAMLPTLARLGLGHADAPPSNLPAPAAEQVAAMTTTARSATNGRDELAVVPELFEQAQSLTTLGHRPLAVVTASDSLEGDGWAAAQDLVAALSTNSIHWTADSTHAGLLEDERPAAESVRAIADVVVSSPHRHPAGRPVTTRAMEAATASPAEPTIPPTPYQPPQCRTRGVPMSNTTHPQPAPEAASRTYIGHPVTPSVPDVTKKSWALLAVTLAAQVLVVLDISVVNTALPSIASSLHIEGGQLQWLVTAYLMMSGGGLLLGGRIADLLSRRRVFLTGLTLFTIASLLSAFSESGGQLIAARAVQGLSAALLTPSALSLIMTTYAGTQRKTALAMWGAVGSLGVAVGVLLGGALTTWASWQAIFWINVPVGAVALIVGRRTIAKDTTPRASIRDFDVPGAVAVIGGIGALIYGLGNTATRGWWSVPTVATLALAAGLIMLFLKIEKRAAKPLFPPHVWKLNALVSGTGVMLGVTGILVGVVFLTSIFLQTVLGFSALETGLAFLPFALAITAGTLVARPILHHLTPRVVATVGLLLTVVASVWLSSADSNAHLLTDILPALTLLGLGVGMVFVPVSVTSMDGIPASHAGVASGFLMTGHEIGAALGVAILSAVASTAGTLTTAAGAADACSAGFIGSAVMGGMIAVFALLRMPATRASTGRPHAHALSPCLTGEVGPQRTERSLRRPGPGAVRAFADALVDWDAQPGHLAGPMIPDSDERRGHRITKPAEEMSPMSGFMVEEEQGTFTRTDRRHNGYYAGDFSEVPMAATTRQTRQLDSLRTTPIAVAPRRTRHLVRIATQADRLGRLATRTFPHPRKREVARRPVGCASYSRPLEQPFEGWQQ